MSEERGRDTARPRGERCYPTHYVHLPAVSERQLNDEMAAYSALPEQIRYEASAEYVEIELGPEKGRTSRS